MEERKNFRIAYQAHDNEYRRRRARGYSGWDTEESLVQTVAVLNDFLADRVLPDCGNVLELGCGAGNLLLPFAQKGWLVFGVDIAPYAIEWAREKHQGGSAWFGVGDVTKELLFDIPRADLVIDGHCLHCIIGEEDRQMFLKNARKYLKADGYFLIHTMCGDVKHEESRKSFDWENRVVVWNDIATRYFGRPEEIVKEVARAGIEIVKEKWIGARDVGDEDTLLILGRIGGAAE